MKFSDETLMAYADGELDSATRADIEGAMAGDPDVARAVERHRRLAARVRTAYAAELEEPVPARLSALVAKPAGRGIALRRWQAPAWTALAASVVGLGVAVLLMREPAVPYEEVGGVLLARADLDEALTSALASRPEDARVSIGISFRDRQGDFCRTFQLRQEEPVAGLACRHGEAWQLRALAKAAAQEGEVRTASAMPLAVLQAVDAAIDGEPLDAAAEAAARDAGWRNMRAVAE